MKVLALLMVLMPTISLGSESECLARIMHSEASGEALEGLIAVGQASINRSKATKKSVCNIRGVTRKNPPTIIAKYYLSLAEAILDGGASIVGAADSWERRIVPRYRGSRITRRIGHHTFYIMKGLK